MSKKPAALRILDVTSIVLLLIATGMVFFYAPIEKVMGLVQKVFYFHVATAWVGMVSFGLAAVVGIIYLIKKDERFDLISVASVEIGLVFTMICLISGSIWARPIWNAWWTWDPRLTTVTIMELVYFAYLMLRNGIEEPERRARFGAVYAIIGFVSVPLTFFSIRLFRTIHPVVVGGSDPAATGAFDMTPLMLQTFLFSLFTFTVIYVDLLWNRIRLGKLAQSVEQLKLRLQS
ncbi:MAG TPA: cytochrome c biogenesis protein CcsA [Bellilinea sp.]|jgi:heme exporter protein C|nr:cytochrome c biogenesis protein CcsA [Bellilinea sp.]